MAPVVTINVTVLNHHSISEMTMELLETILYGLENRRLTYTMDTTFSLVINGRATWTAFYHNGGWQAMNVN